MKDTFRSLVLIPVLLVAAVCNASPVSDTNVAHAPTFAEMLQLTQTPDGQITGVLTRASLLFKCRCYTRCAPNEIGA
jgi:hypothetical protein